MPSEPDPPAGSGVASGPDAGRDLVPPGKLAKSPPAGAVDACLRRVLGGDDFSVEPAASGLSTPVYRVTTRGTVLYLRLAEGTDADLGP
ncbi:MAG: hypothetical protein J2P58_15075, partial [Acidimicrobiaceae bacterium]|nr:hypothetical protein [Acidimicrobiaceae bacterium]